MKVKQKTTIGRKGLCLIVVTVLLTSPFITYAQDNPLAKYLDVPGAKTTLPVSAAKEPFALGFRAGCPKEV
jgi:hypothetical protein